MFQLFPDSIFFTSWLEKNEGSAYLVTKFTAR